MVVILVVSSAAVFLAIRYARGDVTSALPPFASEEQRQAFLESSRLDEPLPKQYLGFVGDAVTGNFGRSLVSGFEISEMVEVHGRNSLILGAAALGLVFSVGVPLGLLAAARRNRAADIGVLAASTAAISVPNFWLALLSVWLFASVLGWLPTAGCCDARHLTLPALVLAAEGIGLTARMTRAAMVEQMDRDYVRTLRASGLPERRVIGRHVLRNASIPIISLAGLRVGQIIGYALVVETVFGWPGLGRVLVTAVRQRDYPVVQFFTLSIVAIVVIGNWLSDVAYGLADPRLRGDR